MLGGIGCSRDACTDNAFSLCDGCLGLDGGFPLDGGRTADGLAPIDGPGGTNVDTGRTFGGEGFEVPPLLNSSLRRACS
jgi:hypothetical protein